MARRRLSKRRLALFAGVLLCAAFGARRVAIRCPRAATAAGNTSCACAAKSRLISPSTCSYLNNYISSVIFIFW